MIEEARISLYCDHCGVTEEFEMTPLANGGWDSRNLRNDSERVGWTWVGDDEHECPECKTCPDCGDPVDDCQCDFCSDCGCHMEECECFCPECGELEYDCACCIYCFSSPCCCEDEETWEDKAWENGEEI